MCDGLACFPPLFSPFLCFLSPGLSLSGCLDVISRESGLDQDFQRDTRSVQVGSGRSSLRTLMWSDIVREPCSFARRGRPNKGWSHIAAKTADGDALYLRVFFRKSLFYIITNSFDSYIRDKGNGWLVKYMFMILVCCTYLKSQRRSCTCLCPSAISDLLKGRITNVMLVTCIFDQCTACNSSIQICSFLLKQN